MNFQINLSNVLVVIQTDNRRRKCCEKSELKYHWSLQEQSLIASVIKHQLYALDIAKMKDNMICMI